MTTEQILILGSLVVLFVATVFLVATDGWVYALMYLAGVLISVGLVYGFVTFAEAVGK